MFNTEEDYASAFLPNLPEDESYRLASSENFRVRIAIAANPAIGKDASRVLLRDHSPQVALTVLRNSSCDTEELLDFLTSPTARNHAFIADLIHEDRHPEAKYAFWKVCCVLDPSTPVWDYFQLVHPRESWTEDRFPFRYAQGVYGDDQYVKPSR